jgi:hypothetical protein
LWSISFALLAAEAVLADQQPVGWVEVRNPAFRGVIVLGFRKAITQPTAYRDTPFAKWVIHPKAHKPL